MRLTSEFWFSVREAVVVIGIILICGAGAVFWYSHLKPLSMPASVPTPAATDDVDSDPTVSAHNADKLCMMADATKLESAPCWVSGWNSSVNVTFDTTSAEARSLCTRMQEIEHAGHLVFKPGWRMNIYSPYSTNSIAFCPL